MECGAVRTEYVVCCAIVVYMQSAVAHPLGDYCEIFWVSRQLCDGLNNKIKIVYSPYFQCHLVANYTPDANTFWRCENCMNLLYAKFGEDFSCAGLWERNSSAFLNFHFLFVHMFLIVKFVNTTLPWCSGVEFFFS